MVSASAMDERRQVPLLGFARDSVPLQALCKKLGSAVAESMTGARIHPPQDFMHGVRLFTIL